MTQAAPYLISKLLAIDGLAASAVAACEVCDDAKCGLSADRHHQDTTRRLETYWRA